MHAAPQIRVVCGGGCAEIHALLMPAVVVRMSACLAGVFLLRRSEWSRNFLKHVYGANDSAFIKHDWWEQAAMFHFLSPYGPLNGSLSELREHWRHIRLVPQQWINPYPNATATSLRDEQGGLHAAYRKGDWVISFSGCNFVMQRGECQQQMQDIGLRSLAQYSIPMAD